jgi:hypothetical protein
MRFNIKRAIVLFSFFLLPFAFSFIAHTQQPEPPARGVLRLKVRYKSGDVTKDLPRKRFFMIIGSLDDNKALIERIKSQAPLTRECYYRSKGASEALIKWLKESDCDSVYCRQIEEKYLAGSEAVPEFQTAYEQALRDFKSPEIARKWLTNNLPPDLRSGFYSEKQQAIQALLAQIPQTNSVKPMSVMTDRKGTGYLTDIEPGTYTISNLIPSETEKTNILWACERQVKAVDLATAMRRPFTLLNEKDPKVKCEIVERPLPVCMK